MLKHNVAIYLRLSKEDGDDFESENITNQRKIIRDYISKFDNMQIYDEYIDDGYSGANFDRPSFKRMLKDIESKKINMVITKNLARFGRNYIEAGSYIEKYFPDHRVRYIAILDDIDNYSDSAINDFMPLKSVFNEKYCKNTSDAVKKSKRRKMQEGYYNCNTAPFGYKKDPDNPGKLIIDKESSKTVKKIFELKLNGYTIPQIVKYLDENKYITPAEYLKIRGQEKIKNKDIWKRGSVTRILSNKVYLGHCVRGKTQNISYKSKKRIYTKRNDYIITLNTHEAIISEEDFNKIHNTKKYGLIRNSNIVDYLLKDSVYCKDCGRKLIVKNERGKLYLYCWLNRESQKLCRNDFKLEYKEIEDKILEYIMHAYEEYIDKEKIINKVLNVQANSEKDELSNLNKELNNTNGKIAVLYNQRLSGKIEENEYKDRYNTLLNKRKKLTNRISELEGKIRENMVKLDNANKQNEILEKIYNLNKTDLGKSDINELISKIEISTNDICIHFKYANTNTFKIF